MKNTTNERTSIGTRVTISPRGKKGIYTADFHYGGRHCRRSLKTTNKKVATQKAIKLENQLMEGYDIHTPTNNDKTRVIIEIAMACKDFAAYLLAEGRRRKTIVKYEGILRRFLDFVTGLGVTLLNEIDLRLVDRYRAFRQPDLSPKSMHHEGALLKLFFSWCVERSLMPINPLAGRKFTPPLAKPRGGPNLEQINKVLEISSACRHPIIAVAAFAGMRIGEIAHLRVEDVDFVGNWIHVVSRTGYETKSGDSWKVPIHPRLRKILEALPRTKQGWFFTAQPSRKYPLGDHHINPKHVNEDFIECLKSLEIPTGRADGFTFHSLRSSFKTICINSGVPREMVDIWQNHAPDRAASHVYYKLADEDSQKHMLKVPFED